MWFATLNLPTYSCTYSFTRLWIVRLLSVWGCGCDKERFSLPKIEIVKHLQIYNLQKYKLQWFTQTTQWSRERGNSSDRFEFKKAVLVSLSMFSLERSTTGIFAVSFEEFCIIFWGILPKKGTERFKFWHPVGLKKLQVPRKPDLGTFRNAFPYFRPSPSFLYRSHLLGQWRDLPRYTYPQTRLHNPLQRSGWCGYPAAVLALVTWKYLIHLK